MPHAPTNKDKFQGLTRTTTSNYQSYQKNHIKPPMIEAELKLSQYFSDNEPAIDSYKNKNNNHYLHVIS